MWARAQERTSSGTDMATAGRASLGAARSTVPDGAKADADATKVRSSCLLWPATLSARDSVSASLPLAPAAEEVPSTRSSPLGTIIFIDQEPRRWRVRVLCSFVRSFN